METVKTIIKTLGREPLALALGVGVKAVGAASVAGRFPANWYLIIKALCGAAGLHCPDALFSFKPVPAGLLDTSAGGTP